jgi:hypothetical protein
MLLNFFFPEKDTLANPAGFNGCRVFEVNKTVIFRDDNAKRSRMN